MPFVTGGLRVAVECGSSVTGGLEVVDECESSVSGSKNVDFEVMSSQSCKKHNQLCLQFQYTYKFLKENFRKRRYFCRF